MAGSAPFGGNLERFADGPPDLLRGQTGVQRLVDRTAAQSGEDVVMGDRVGAAGAELIGEPGAENGDTHRRRVYVRGRITRVLLLAIPGPSETESLWLDIGVLAALVVVILVGIVAYRNNRRR